MSLFIDSYYLVVPLLYPSSFQPLSGVHAAWCWKADGGKYYVCWALPAIHGYLCRGVQPVEMFLQLWDTHTALQFTGPTKLWQGKGLVVGTMFRVFMK